MDRTLTAPLYSVTSHTNHRIKLEDHGVVDGPHSLPACERVRERRVGLVQRDAAFEHRGLVVAGVPLNATS